MAKKNRFPSDANKVNKLKKTAPKDAPKESAEEQKIVEGVKQEHVQLEYKGENHHFLTHVHHLAKGINTIPKKVYDECKDHFVFKDLVEKGIIVLMFEEISNEEAQELVDSGEAEIDEDALVEGGEGEEESDEKSE